MAADERPIPLVDVRGEEVGAQRVGPRDQHGRDVQDVSGQASRHQRPDELAGGDQHLAAEVPALLLGRELIFEVHARCARLDHRGHQLEGVERAAETGLGVRDDRQTELGVVPLGPGDLVCAPQGVVQTADDRGHRAHRVERLVGVRVQRGVGVGGHLPAGQVDRTKTRSCALHRLATREAAERGHVVLGVDEPPQGFRGRFRDHVAFPDRASEPNDVLGLIRPGDPLPALLVPPPGAQVVGFLADPFGDRHRCPAFPPCARVFAGRDPCGITKPPGVREVGCARRPGRPLRGSAGYVLERSFNHRAHPARPRLAWSNRKSRIRR